MKPTFTNLIICILVINSFVSFKLHLKEFRLRKSYKKDKISISYLSIQAKRKKDMVLPETIAITLLINENKILTGFIKLGTIDSPGEDYNRGLYIFDYDGFKEKDKASYHVLTRDGQSLFLPYRLMFSGFEYINSFENMKYLQVISKPNLSDTYIIKLLLEYKYLGYDMNEEIYLKIVRLLNININAKQMEILNLKSSINQIAINYLNHFTLYNKLTEDAALLSDQVQVNLKLISNIKEKIATNNAVILEQVEVVSQLEIKLADLRISLHMVLERANQLANLIYIMTGVHSKLQAEKEDIDISKLKLDAEQGRIEYEALQEQLIDLAPQDKKSILKAHEALFENNNIFNCQDALREIHP